MSPRISPEMYLDIRDWLLTNDPDGPDMHDWAETIEPPECAEHLAGEIIWIILCAGRSAQAARTLQRRVKSAILSGQSAFTAFGYRAKAAAIDRAWNERDSDFAKFLELRKQGDDTAMLAWFKSIPFIGDDTQFQLAKNVGVDVCKPDIWLCRLAGFPDRRPRRPLKVRFPACMDLCRPLAESSKSRIATVDTMLWLACNKGLLDVSPASVIFNRKISTKRAIG